MTLIHPSQTPAFSRRSALIGVAGLGLGAMVPILTSPREAQAFTTSVTGSWPVLRQGSTGRAVRIIQGVVRAGVDGAFGPATATAVKNFQKSKGLTADGVVGPATWAAASATVRQGNINDHVRGVQAGLSIAVDGNFGSGTRGAVLNFQGGNGLAKDGVAGPATWAKLVGASGGASGGNPRAFSNGYVPDSALAYVGFGNSAWRLSTYCINDFKAMNAAFRAHFGINLPITPGNMTCYRTYQQQVYLYNEYLAGRGNLAAKPGTSNHGWGLAADISVGARYSAHYNWLNANGPRFGFDDRVSSEQWHWEYTR